MGFLSRLFEKISKLSDPGFESSYKLPKGWTETKVSDDLYALHIPSSQKDQWKAERHEKDKVDELIAKNGFYNCYHGREGFIYYVEDGHLCEIGYESSGVKEYDIALASVDLREWERPKGMTIPRDKQLEILQELRSWLKEQKLRTRIDLRTNIEFVDRRCAWKECNEKRIKGSAYCPHHYDTNLLRE